MLTDLSDAALKKAAADIGKDAGDSLAWFAADVTKSDQVKNCIASTVSRFGKIDVLFSNAGNFGIVAPITDYPEDVFDSVLAVHVKGAFLAAKHALPHMNDGGSIIITSSIVGVKGDSGRLRLHHRQARPGRADAGAGQGARRAQHPRQHHSFRPGGQQLPAVERGKRNWAN